MRTLAHAARRLTPALATALAPAGALIAALAGCGADNAPQGPPITRLAGDIHIHQYTDSGHALAQFAAAPLPLASVRLDGLGHLDFAPTIVDGPCGLILPPTCRPACGDDQYCSQPDVCSPLRPFTQVDGGEVRVSGGRLVPLIRLLWSAASGGYYSEPADLGGPIFQGGEVLAVRGGGIDRYAFDGAVRAPQPLSLRDALPGPAGRLPAAGALDLSWQPAGAAAVEVFLTVSRSDGRWGQVSCQVPDQGAVRVGARLLAGLPPPPRTVTLTVSRVEQQLMPTREPGTGVAAHAEFSLGVSWDEGPILGQVISP